MRVGRRSLPPPPTGCDMKREGWGQMILHNGFRRRGWLAVGWVVKMRRKKSICRADVNDGMHMKRGTADQGACDQRVARVLVGGVWAQKAFSLVGIFQFQFWGN